MSAENHLWLCCHDIIPLVMGNVCLGSGSCCKPDRSNGAAAYRGCHQGKSIDNPYLDPSPGIRQLEMKLDILPSCFNIWLEYFISKLQPLIEKYV